MSSVTFLVDDVRETVHVPGNIIRQGTADEIVLRVYRKDCLTEDDPAIIECRKELSKHIGELIVRLRPGKDTRVNHLPREGALHLHKGDTRIRKLPLVGVEN